jgi:FMN phosphatase YigB (HAD superfamily)
MDGAILAGMDSVWLDHRSTHDAKGRAVTHILQDIRDLPAYLMEA